MGDERWGMDGSSRGWRAPSRIFLSISARSSLASCGVWETMLMSESVHSPGQSGTSSLGRRHKHHATESAVGAQKLQPDA